jgi:hypothetical protein
MKLYTEEQVKEMIDDAHNGIDGYYDIFKKHTPIELPTEEEIKEYSLHYATMNEDISDKLGKYLVKSVHMDGAQWVINKIQGGNR